MLKDPDRLKFSKNLVLSVRTDNARFYTPVDIESFTLNLFEKLLPSGVEMARSGERDSAALEA